MRELKQITNKVFELLSPYYQIEDVLFEVTINQTAETKVDVAIFLTDDGILDTFRWTPELSESELVSLIMACADPDDISDKING